MFCSGVKKLTSLVAQVKPRSKMAKPRRSRRRESYRAAIAPTRATGPQSVSQSVISRSRPALTPPRLQITGSQSGSAAPGLTDFNTSTEYSLPGATQLSQVTSTSRSTNSNIANNGTANGGGGGGGGGGGRGARDRRLLRLRAMREARPRMAPISLDKHGPHIGMIRCTTRIIS